MSVRPYARYNLYDKAFFKKMGREIFSQKKA